MKYFWWGCRGNLTLISLGSEKVEKNQTKRCSYETRKLVGHGRTGNRAIAAVQHSRLYQTGNNTPGFSPFQIFSHHLPSPPLPLPPFPFPYSPPSPLLPQFSAGAWSAPLCGSNPMHVWPLVQSVRVLLSDKGIKQQSDTRLRFSIIRLE